jgi:hypothetical protein
MKKTYSLLLIAAMFMLSCNKSKDFYGELGKGSYLTLISVGNTNVAAADATSTVSMKVSSNGEPVKSVNLYVSPKASLNKTDWKLLKNVPFSGETTLSTTHAEIATALGLTVGNLDPGKVFFLYNELVTEAGQTFSSINTSGPDLETQFAFNTAMKWQATVVCAFEPGPFDNTTFIVIRDDWEDFAPGSEVTVKLGPGANQITLVDVFPTVDAHVDLVINIDPASGVATVPKYNYGAYSVGGTKYTAATTGSSNFVFACTETIDLTLNQQTAGGSNFGNFKLVLKKKE